MRPRLVSISAHSGPPLRAGNHIIRLNAWSLRLTVPGTDGTDFIRLVWTRPVSVRVQSAGSDERIIPVRDVTRWIELALWATLALAALVAASVSITAHRATTRSPQQGVSHE